MGLEATIQAAVVTAFDAADDLVASVVLTRQQAGQYDAANGNMAHVEVEFEFEAIVDEVSETAPSGGGQRATGGSEIEQAEATVYMKPGETDPVRGDVLRIGETKYRVLTVDPLKPNGVTVLLWTIGVAR